MPSPAASPSTPTASRSPPERPTHKELLKRILSRTPFLSAARLCTNPVGAEPSRRTRASDGVTAPPVSPPESGPNGTRKGTDRGLRALRRSMPRGRSAARSAGGRTRTAAPRPDPLPGATSRDSPRRTRQIRRTSGGVDVPGRGPSLGARPLARSWERIARIRALGSQPPPPPGWRGAPEKPYPRLVILRQPVRVRGGKLIEIVGGASMCRVPTVRHRMSGLRAVAPRR
jgi:hypothetical protein